MDEYITDEELMEESVLDQMPDYDRDVINNVSYEPDQPVLPQVVQPPVQEKKESFIGTKLNHTPGKSAYADDDHMEKVKKEKHLTRVGETIGQNSEIREGWIEVDPELLGDRALFYPEDWRFRIRPATVEAIRSWSTIDEENPNLVDDVFNEMLKSCLSIMTPAGPIPWGNLNVWDRFFFILLIREYSFVQGEAKIEYTEECPECDNDVTFTLTSQALMYDIPDKEIMKHYNREERAWYIDPEEYEVSGNPITLYVPTLDKDAKIKEYVMDKMRQNPNKKFDNTFFKFLQWMPKKINKDPEFRNKQIKELEMKYKSWDTEMFSFMDDVIRNIMIMPSTKLQTTCPTCGEEVSSPIRFPNSINDLFNVSHKHKKFGSK